MRYKKKAILLIALFGCLLCGGIIIFGGAILRILIPITEEKCNEVISPNGEHTIVAYIKNSGATNPFTVRCELINNVSGKRKNIYWERGARQAVIEWKNNDEVMINDHNLNIYTDCFDNR